MSRQLLLEVHQGLIVDLFGGGGMSTAYEADLGRRPDIAIRISNKVTGRQFDRELHDQHP